MRTGTEGRTDLRASARTLGWTLTLLACACSRAPEPPAAEAPPPGASAATAGGPQVTVRGDERDAVFEVWTPPPVEIAPDADRRALRRQAAAALEQGRLYEDAEAAVPLYLALLRADADDAVARRGLGRARQALLRAGRQALDAVAADADADGVALRRATALAAVARAVAAEDAQVQALQQAVERARRVAELDRAGEEDLRAGRLDGPGEGALGYFREALALAPEDPRARQGLAAVESALIDRAEAAARSVDFEAAGHWLEQAQAVRGDAAGAVADARGRVDAIREGHILALRDAALRDLLQPTGLRQARARLAEALRIAPPGHAVVAQLRERIDLVTHYGVFRPGQVFTDALADGSRGPQMVVVPHGAFRMGAEDSDPQAADAEKPAHYVRFDRGFAMSLTEVTVAEFGRYVAATGARPRATRRGNSIVYDERSGNFVRRSGVDWRSSYDGSPARPNDPVLHVSVHDAEAYAAWLSEQTGRHYRLPSEAEFEYALRAGTRGRYPWGDDPVPPERVGNLTGGEDVSPSGRRWNNAFAGYGDGYWGIAPVGRFAPNAWGLHDLAGNASEWVADCWHASYRRAPADGAPWFNPGCRTRVVRGGSWAGSPAQTRAAWRAPMDSDMTSGRVGFRLVRGI
ncbi:formylglycine-generating enzyme family protein [Pseudoxanthomonas taiwanensis]|uniref:Serine/threonine kinase n=1 Tax=Pseudoxanthomonas taiwanensis TaxID=176598 RepID=A0A921TF25_9GAMM|nr:serine/threonine kinase [Pseudoxanthomonas taiwanensis]